MNGDDPQESIYDALGVVVIRVSAQLEVWYVNAFGLQLLGYSRLGDVFRWPLLDLLGLDPAQTSEFVAQIRDIGAHGHIRDLETALTTCDGRRIWIAWTIEQRTGADAILAPIFLVGADVTRVRERTSAALLFRDIAQNNPLSIIITDAELSIVFANPAASAITGYAASEVLGRTPRMFRSGLTPERTYRELWAALHAGMVWAGEFINQRKNGEIYRERKTISPIVDDQGHTCSYFSIGEDLSTQHDLEERLAALSSIDTLTGLHNRASFLGELTRMTQVAAASGAGVYVVHLDVDHFERVNRLLGQEHADRILVDIARRLSDHVRVGDVVARLGGDEFGLLLAVSEVPSVEPSDEVSDRLLLAIRPPFVVAGREMEVTSSIGIAFFPRDGNDAGDLLARAAGATQTAKRAGGNCVVHFDPILAQEDSSRHQLLADLRCALPGNQLLLHYQPQVNLQTGAVIGLEALVR